MEGPAFSTRFDNLSDKAFAAGKPPGKGSQLGKFRAAITDPRELDNPFVAYRFNPNRIGTTSFDDATADASRAKIEQASSATGSNFQDKATKQSADGFLAKYTEGLNSGFIQDGVNKDNLGMFLQGDAAARLGPKDPNVKGTFPSQGVAV